MPRNDGHNITRGRTTGALWFGVLAGPLAALMMEQLNYMVVPAACKQPSHHVWPILLHAVPIVLILLTLIAGVVAWRTDIHQRQQPTNPHPDATVSDAGVPDGRIHFMSQLGVWLSLLSILVLTAEWIPVFILHPCWGT